MSTGRWYHLKKAYAVFPGGAAPVAAPPLLPHYQRLAASRGPAACARDALVAKAFRAWVPGRAKQIARRCRLDEDWAAMAAEVGAACMIDPADIALCDIECAADADKIIRRYEFAGLNKRFNPANWAPDCGLADKIRFAARCAEAGLPHPAVVAARRGRGPVEVFADHDGGDLFLKPIGGVAGRGAARLSPEAMAKPALATWLTETANDRRDWIAQTRLSPHPDLSPLVNETTTTARITTMLNEDGAPEIVTTSVRIPLDPNALVDNRALVAHVDAASGRIAPAMLMWAKGDVRARFDRHPENGAEIAGVRVPMWEDAKALTLSAHEAFRDYTMIGWDVALAAEGLHLIEGNGKPSITLAQRGRGQGAFETRLGPLVVHHLERAAGD